jgi:hypothetical protein
VRSLEIPVSCAVMEGQLAGAVGCFNFLYAVHDVDIIVAGSMSLRNIGFAHCTKSRQRIASKRRL